MKGHTSRKKSLFISAFGAVLATFCGLLLWGTPFGEPLVNASYDYLFRFGSHPVTNNVVLVLMDNDAFAHFHQVRGQPWDRGLHARLLNKLADDGCSMVVFDSFFRAPRDPIKDAALAAAMRRQKHIVLMATQARMSHPTLAGVEPLLPAKLFLDASGTNWGVAWLTPDLDSIVRRVWPFPSPGPYPSLPWTAAQLAGANLSPKPQKRWLRYYGQDGDWPRISYQFALTQPSNYFHNRIVFIGTEPETSMPDREVDEFRTPYTRWTGEASGGVDILVTSFLNLLNHDWLQRPAWWIELLLFTASGLLLGGGLCRMRLVIAMTAAGGIVLAVTLVAILLSYFTNYWFPWLIIVGGQAPCALAWMMAVKIQRAPKPDKTILMEPLPDTPGYKLFHPPFGAGAYGKVWLAQSTAGQWCALKVIYRAKFGDDPEPYEREFKGIQQYKPISSEHPGLLRVDFVSEKRAEYFYYVMELGDSLEPGWETNPSLFKPCDLFSISARFPKRRLPVKECLRAGIILCEALDFIHQQGMTHRDIKPQNIIFINGQPKLGDFGLVTEIRPPDQERTLVGTPGYMPPSPERPGTVQADIYALGMVLYVSSTGRAPGLFPEIATTLVNTEEPTDFLPLNSIVLKACQPLPADRFATALEMRVALLQAFKTIQAG